MTASDVSLTALEQADAFVGRHIGPRDGDVAAMLESVGYESLDALVDAAVPASIRAAIPDGFPESRTERDVLTALAELAGRNRVARSMIGLGYHDTLTPPGYPAQHPGESGLVHRLHTLSAGDFPREAGGAAQLPDHGDGPHRP